MLDLSLESSNRWADSEYIRELSKDRELLNAFWILTNCHPKSLVEALRLRTSNELIHLWTQDDVDRSAVFDKGYNSFQALKDDGSFRTINEPAPVLKKVQSEIKDILLWQIETYVWAIWWEKGRSFIDNAKMHGVNHLRYLINMDLAHAYPSVDMQRVFVNFRAAIFKKIDMSFPHFSQAQRDSLIDLLVILTTLWDEIPQGAPTSMKILNIVLANADKRITKFAHGDEAWLHSPLYTRYVDDMSISWKDFSDTNEIWKNRAKVMNLLSEIWAWLEKPELSSDAIQDYVRKLSVVFQWIEQTQFTLANRRQRSAIIEMLTNLQLIIKEFFCYAQDNMNDDAQLYIKSIQGRVIDFRKLVEKMSIEDKSWYIAQRVRQILIQEWWRVKDTKTRIYWPDSSAQKVVTWVTIGTQWELWIPAKKVTEIEWFLIDCITNPTHLPKRLRGNNERIADTILWYRNYILQVRWWLSSRFQKLFDESLALYAPNRVHGYSYRAGFWYNWS